MRPYDADTEKKVCELQRDSIDVGRTAFSIDEYHVYLAREDRGAEGRIEIPRKEFRKIVDWFLTEQASRTNALEGK